MRNDLAAEWQREMKKPMRHAACGGCCARFNFSVWFAYVSHKLHIRAPQIRSMAWHDATRRRWGTPWPDLIWSDLTWPDLTWPDQWPFASLFHLTFSRCDLEFFLFIDHVKIVLIRLIIWSSPYIYNSSDTSTSTYQSRYNSSHIYT